jgi:hypothetical protein
VEHYKSDHTLRLNGERERSFYASLHPYESEALTREARGKLEKGTEWLEHGESAAIAKIEDIGAAQTRTGSSLGVNLERSIITIVSRSAETREEVELCRHVLGNLPDSHPLAVSSEAKTDA